MKPEETERLMDALDTKMKWGAHKGKRLGDIPSGYLKWVAENWSDDRVATAADLVWSDRDNLNDHWED